MQGGVRARARARLRSRPTLREYASSWLPSVLDLAVRTLSPLPPHTQRAIDACEPKEPKPEPWKVMRVPPLMGPPVG